MQNDFSSLLGSTEIIRFGSGFGFPFGWLDTFIPIGFHQPRPFRAPGRGGAGGWTRARLGSVRDHWGEMIYLDGSGLE